MIEQPEKTVISVQIAGEEYKIRADATPEYTRDCAAYVDRTITAILEGGSTLQVSRAAILGALAITDELFRARRQIEAVRAESGRRAGRLAADIEARSG